MEQNQNNSSFKPNTESDFSNFQICTESVENLQSRDITHLFPIQVKTFKHIYNGLDVIGRDRTGSGKTIAFLLPILERMRSTQNYFNQKRGQKPFLIILAPTRELAMQIFRESIKLKNFQNEYRSLSVYGGTDIQAQIRNLQKGVEIVVGTPGRVIDLIQQEKLLLDNVEVFVLDETDQMLDIGFQDDIEKIFMMLREQKLKFQKNPQNVQYLLFSATLPPWVDKLSQKFLKQNVKKIDLIQRQDNKTSQTVNHLSIFFKNQQQKQQVIGDIALVYGGQHCRTIIFTDQKVQANDILLKSDLKVSAQVLHGDIPQSQREIILQSFREGKLRILIATNLAARGLDIPKVDLIIQLSPPNDGNSYIHRSGRTGRAGNIGTCITFFTKEERDLIDKIEITAKIKIKQIGIPQVTDIMKANARDIAISFDEINTEVLPYFQESSEQILLKYDAHDALNRALALISGYTTSIQQRSLLSGSEGLVTLILEFHQKIPHINFVFEFFKQHLPQKHSYQIQSVKLLHNFKGVVFDVPQDVKLIFLKLQQIEKVIIKEALILPRYFDNDQQNQKNRKNKQNNFQDIKMNLKKGSNFQDRNFKSQKGKYFNNNNYYQQQSYPEKNNNLSEISNQNKKNQYYYDQGFKNPNHFYEPSDGDNQFLQRFKQNSNHKVQKNYQNNQNLQREQIQKIPSFNELSVQQQYKPNFIKNSQEQYFELNQSSQEQSIDQFNHHSFNDNNFVKNKKNFNRDQNKSNHSIDNTTLFVSNIHYNVNEEQLEFIFQDKGFNPINVKLIRNKEDQSSKGFGYVKFDNTEVASQAIQKLNKLKIQNRLINVCFSEKRNNKQFYINIYFYINYNLLFLYSSSYHIITSFFIYIYYHSSLIILITYKNLMIEQKITFLIKFLFHYYFTLLNYSNQLLNQIFLFSFNILNMFQNK